MLSPRNTLVVGITGQARAGKDTLARALMGVMKHYSVNAQHMAFAAPLKSIYSKFLGVKANAEAAKTNPMWESNAKIALLSGGITHEQADAAFDHLMWNLDFSRDVMATDFMSDAYKPLHRRNLIDLGCYMRSIDEDYWVNALVNYADGFCDILLVTDLRFENETKVVDYVVRVVRPETEVLRDPATGFIDQSEQFAITGSYDYLVDNSGSMANLFDEAKYLFDEIIVQHSMKMFVTGVV